MNHIIQLILAGYLCGCVASVGALFDRDGAETSWGTAVVGLLWPAVAVVALVSVPFTYRWGFDLWRLSVAGLPGFAVGASVRALGSDWCAGIAVRRLEHAHHLGPLFVGGVR